MEAKIETILLMLAINFHREARCEVERLENVRAKFKATGVECRLIDRRLLVAREIERQSRDELLGCPANTIQEVAAKAVHLRQVLFKDQTISEASERSL
jgi:hypothetical protein